jgi:Ribbon-helix-helix protein
MKDAGLRIRIDRQLRDAFVRVCREQDKPAAQVLREFMRGYVAAHKQGGPAKKQLKQKN